MDNFVGMFRKALCVFHKCIWTMWPLAKGVFSRTKQLDVLEQTWKWKYNTGFNWLFAETGMVLQDKLEQVVRVDEINLVPELSNFFPFRRNFFCPFCPRLIDPSKPLKALCHTFYGQRLLFWVNGLSWDSPDSSARDVALPWPSPWHWSLWPFSAVSSPKIAQLVTPPVPISFHCFFCWVFFFFFWL